VWYRDEQGRRLIILPEQTKEKAMSVKKRSQKLAKQPKASPDSLTKTSKKQDVELTEAELKRVSGGVIPGKIKF
jgi:hypothetical protein